jgi:hypothetical protein
MNPLMRRAVAVLACCLALAGCTGSGGEDTRKTLRGVLLQLDDFPPTWRSFEPSDKDIDLLSDLATCTADEHHGSGKLVRSGTFRHGAEQIASTAVGFDTQQQVSDRVDAIGDQKAPRCLARILDPVVRDATNGATPVSADYHAIAGAFNSAVNLVGTADGIVKVKAGDRTTKVYVDVAFITGRDFYAYVTFIGVGRRISERIRNIITNDVASRGQHV